MTDHKLAVPAVLLGAWLATGCGTSGPETFQATGTVTWKGQPVPMGMLRLEPDTKAGNSGPGAVAEIIQGRYATPRGKGVVGGKYRVYVSGTDGVPYDNPEEGYRDPLGRPLFVDMVQEVEFPRITTTHDFILSAP